MAARCCCGCTGVAGLCRLWLVGLTAASLSPPPPHPTPPALLQVPPDEQVVEVFRELDIDGNGSISRAELAAVMFRWFIVGVC